MPCSPLDTRRLNSHFSSWIPAGEFSVNFGLMIDPLSMTFVILVTSSVRLSTSTPSPMVPMRVAVSLPTSTFIAAMLILVLLDPYAGLFVDGKRAWPVPAHRFLNYVPANAVAAKKAFVMNRVGDMGLLIAMMAMVANFSTVNIEEVNAAVATVSPVQATIIGFFPAGGRLR